MKYKVIEEEITVSNGSSKFSNTYVLTNDGMVLKYLFVVGASSVDIQLMVGGIPKRKFLFEDQKLEVMEEVYKNEDVKIKITNSSGASITAYVYLLIQEY